MSSKPVSRRRSLRQQGKPAAPVIGSTHPPAAPPPPPAAFNVNVNPPPQPAPPPPDYFEGQVGAYCAKHAMNNLVNQNVWTIHDLIDASGNTRLRNWNSTDIVTAVNRKEPHEAIVVMMWGPTRTLPKEYMEQLLQNQSLVGFIVRPNGAKHWVAIRCKQTVFELYDSIAKPHVQRWEGVDTLWDQLTKYYDPDLVAVSNAKGTFDTIKCVIHADHCASKGSVAETDENTVDLSGT